MKKQPFWGFIFLHFLLMTPLARSATDLEIKVQEILDNTTPRTQVHDVKQLAKLGKPAVPILIAKLSDTSSAVLILNALERIKDPASVLPLISHLQQLNLSDQKQINISRALFSALKEIGDRRAESRLLEILRDEKIFIANRVYAATALARIGSAQTQEEVRDFVLNSPAVNAKVVSPSDLDTAYFEIGTKEALARLEHGLAAGLAYEQLFIVDLLAQKPTPQMIEILFQTAENKEAFPLVRHRAIEALMKHSDSKEKLLKALHSLRNDVPDTSNDLLDKKKVDSMIERVQKKRGGESRKNEP